MPRKKSARKSTRKLTKRKTSVSKSVKRSSSNGLGNSLLVAVVSLIINVLIPGLGSLIGGRTKAGIWQLIIAIIGVVLTGFLIPVNVFGYALFGIAWVWALIVGIKLIKKSD